MSSQIFIKFGSTDVEIKWVKARFDTLVREVENKVKDILIAYQARLLTFDKILSD